MPLHFTKMHGLGNDFIVIDAINQAVNLSKEQIHKLADRHFGVGFDQLLLVEKPVSTDTDFKYRIFNADGGEVSQCGNGARCFAKFVRDKGLFKGDVIRVDTNSGGLVLEIRPDGMVKVNMGVPEFKPEKIPMLLGHEAKSHELEVDGETVHFGAVSLGNPHAVLEVVNVNTAPVNSLGPKLEHHAVFPQRANIGFMQVIDRNHIKLRVFERGSGETLACGSGACAAVVVGIEQNLLDNEVSVELRGGQLLISWAGRNQPVSMTGPATTVFEGTIALI